LEHLVTQRTRELEENLERLKEAQTQLIESEKMASLGTLVAGVAHEINTPVGVALTGVTYLEDELKNLKKIYEDESISEEDFYAFLEHSNQINQSIQINIRRAAELVKSFKQVAIDQSSEEQREIDLKAYVEDIILSLKGRLKHTKHTIKIDIAPNIKLKTYPGVISQILTNLIMNSLIHGFKGVESGEITIAASLQNSRLRVVYKDNGVGMSQEVQKHIYEPFYTTNRENGGSGLGMNIVYNLCEFVIEANV
ncbi:MAG: HAMP domain-containing histidine kinase, partial [Epsilonproteobacteria bacterium]|nr:HAMP domain-containing histidine kinase [Campylobacterota bacterium]